MEQRILSSAPYKSFQSERVVVDLFRDHAWASTHGLYYEDLQTQKQRELDVVARQIWLSGDKAHEWVCRITVLVEVKTMAGFHLLLSPVESPDTRFFDHIRWFGDSTGKYKALSKRFRALGISLEDIDALIKRAHQHAYPEDRARLWEQMIRPQSLMAFTSFRETNFGSEKELDNSVFWRASRNLRSAQASIVESMGRSDMRELLITAEFDHIKDDWVDGMWFTLSRRLNAVDIIHPVVVTDAQLWIVGDEGPRQCNYARFGEQSYNGAIEWWCDLVNSEHLGDYVAAVSSHYAKRLLASGGKLSY
ncbi:hypothetical protein ACN9MB_03395 [Dyella kyungheensis]|uniref:hypothetical protein n=1 Tax=Dyella kyungheensis TaxID=1242174 RepID=UPI003CF3260A